MSFIDRYGRLQVPNFLRKEIKLEGEMDLIPEKWSKSGGKFRASDLHFIGGTMIGGTSRVLDFHSTLL
jgi:hypothetical protein